MCVHSFVIIKQGESMCWLAAQELVEEDTHNVEDTARRHNTTGNCIFVIPIQSICRATVTLEIHTFPSLTSILPLKFVQCTETYLQDLNQQMTCIICTIIIITLPQHYINML